MTGISVHMLIRKVDLLTLQIFLAAVEERQLGRAAVRENISPSAATKRIQDLEDMVGLRLLERTARGVFPSKAGQVLAQRLRRIFADLEEMRRELGKFTDGVRGHVRIAATGAMLVHHLARELGEFIRSFPLIDVEIHEDLNPQVVRMVRGGEVDLAIFVAAEGLGAENLTTFPYRTDRLVAVFPHGHAFSDRTSVTLGDLLDDQIIGIAPGTTLMTQIREAARAAGRELRPKYNVNGVEAARSLVEAGLGVTIQPECMLPVDRPGQIASIAIDEPWARRVMLIAVPSGKPVSPAAQLLLDHLGSRPGRG